MSFKDKVTEFGGRAGFAVKKHSPALCFTSGVVFFGLTVFSAIKKTMTLDEELYEYQEAKRGIAETLEAANNESIPEEERPEYDEEMAKRDRSLAMKKLAFGIAKKYWIVALFGALSVGSFLTGYRIINGRLVAAIGAYTGLDEAFRRYRGRVVETVGEETEREIRTGVKKKEGIVIEKNELGEEVPVKKNVDQVAHDMKYADDQYQVMWDRHTANGYFQIGKDQTYNITFLRQIEDAVNEEIERKGWATEAWARKKLGLPVTGASLTKGWVRSSTNCHPVVFNPVQIFCETGEQVLYDGKLENTLSEFGYILTFNSSYIGDKIHLFERPDPRVRNSRKVHAYA